MINGIENEERCGSLDPVALAKSLRPLVFGRGVLMNAWLLVPDKYLMTIQALTCYQISHL